MNAHENFSMYIAMLVALYNSGVWPLFFFLDTACKFKSRWAKFNKDGPNPKFVLDWLHADGHGAACRLLNSALFILGAQASAHVPANA